MRPVPHSEESPVPKPPQNLTFSDENSDSDKDHRQQGGEQFDCNLTFKVNCSPSEPHLLTQEDLNNSVHDLNLSKNQAELLGFRLKLWNLLRLHMFLSQSPKWIQRIFPLRKWSGILEWFVLSYRPVGHQHDPNGWCLFVDFAKVSLQAVLLHNRNKLPSVPLAHAANIKESYENTNYFWKRSSMKNIIGTTVGI